jgi:KaiC/GvpD/RAD55 family RecA-like ATPase
VQRLSPEKASHYSTGIKGLDQLLGNGLLLGENVLLEIESGTFAREFLYAFMKQGVIEDNQVIYLDFIWPPQALLIQFEPFTKTLPEGWEKKLLVLDCFSEAAGQGELIFSDFYDQAPQWIRKVPSSKDPERFHHFFGRIEREFVIPGTRLVFNSLTLMEHNWGRDSVKTFFGHVCPALYAYQTLAYWTMAKNAHPKEFCAMIEHMTQVVVDLSKVDNKTFLEVRKAGGRYDPQTFQRHAYRVKGFQVDIL